MPQFKLDYSKAVVVQVTNDAFFYITEEEEPLDETNLKEAHKLLAMFPDGFYIEENWKAVSDTGLIEATFIPYVKDSDDYDEFCDVTKYVQLQIKWLDKNNIRAWWCDSQKGTRELYGDFKVYTNQYGLRCFHTCRQDERFIAGKGCLHFMKHFRKRIV